MLIECSGISSCDIRSFSATILYMPVALQMLDAFISPCFESYLYVSTSMSSLSPSISVELGLPKMDLQVRIKNESAVPLGMQSVHGETTKRRTGKTSHRESLGRGLCGGSFCARIPRPRHRRHGGWERMGKGYQNDIRRDRD